MAHLKKFTVAQGIGAFQLLRDLTEYKDYCSSIFGSPTVVELFSVLPDIGKLHIIDPKAFKNLIADSKLSKLEKHEVIELIKMRSDFKQSWLEEYF